MVMSFPAGESRRRRAALSRAQARREDRRSALSGSELPTARPASFLPLAGFAVAAGAVACATVLYGFPVLDRGWRPGPVLIGVALLLVLGYAALPRLVASPSHWTASAAALSLLLPVVLAAGLASQVVVAGKAYLRTSVEAQSFDIASRMQADLLALEASQPLLTLAPDQAMGLEDRYLAATLRAGEIAERWNPAAWPQVPLPGLAEAMRLTNAAAQSQGRALEGYAANLEVPDPARSVEVQDGARRAREQYLLAAQALGQTLAPLGLSLPGQAPASVPS